MAAQLDAPCSPDVLFAWVVDLDRYPRWLDIVPRAEAVDAADGDAGPAWAVDLRGRLGPLARSKRLRMVRSQVDAPRRVVFERREVDGRSHSPWALEATVEPLAGSEGSRLTMQMHYGGNMWGPLLERMLAEEIDKSKPRLLDLIASER